MSGMFFGDTVKAYMALLAVMSCKLNRGRGYMG